jgi:hypothetical protein
MINWEHIYKSFIDKKSNTVFLEGIYTEKHHIIPRYLKGANTSDNLIRLSIRDHVLAHYILWRWKGNLQDRIAYKMKAGQTEEGNILRIQLAVESSREVNRERWLRDNPMENPEIKAQSYITKRIKYNGKVHSQEGLVRIKELCNSGGQQSPKAIKKRVEAASITKSKMSDEEYFEKYIKSHLGENSSMYGKKRPGEQAGNYGTSKGGYTLVSPDGIRQDFQKLVDILRYGVNESTIRNWRNKGTIIAQPNNSRCKWIGYSIEYRRNTKYGDAHKKALESKRIK